MTGSSGQKQTSLLMTPVCLTNFRSLFWLRRTAFYTPRTSRLEGLNRHAMCPSFRRRYSSMLLHKSHFQVYMYTVQIFLAGVLQICIQLAPREPHCNQYLTSRLEKQRSETIVNIRNKENCFATVCPNKFLLKE